jgi:CP family cyanate transporter-like MFS transporter
VTAVRSAPIRRAVPAAAVVVAILLLGLNLRGPIIAVSPVLDTIAADLRIGEATAGLLTSLPVLCFGVVTPLASLLLARAGLGRGVLISLVVLLVGIAVRSLDGLPGALAGTLLIGAAITVGNIAVPVVIGRDLPRHSGPVLGAYTASLNVGSMLTLALTVPLADVLGWRWALVTWGGLVLVAAACWWFAVRDPADGGRNSGAGNPADDEPLDEPEGRPDDEPAAGAKDRPDGDAQPAGAGVSAQPAGAGEPEGPVWWRRPVVWGITAAFAGQAFAYYGVTAWLPLLLRDELGMAASVAGTSASIFQVAALVGAFGVPALLRLLPAPRPVVLIVTAAWAALPLGLLLAPQLWPVWCGIGGAAQGGGLVVVFGLVVRKSRDLTENRRMSALVQGGAYVVASAGPTVVGAVHAATAGWTVPLLVVLVAIALFGVAATVSAGGSGSGTTTARTA